MEGILTAEIERQKTNAKVQRLISMAEKGEIEHFDELPVLEVHVEKVFLEDRVRELERELEKYKKLFPECNSCNQPTSKGELNQYNWCSACNQENKDEYVEDVEFEEPDIEDDDCPV